jgi:hypothetical protein
VVKEYLIGEMKYQQRPLVYGQVRQLQDVLEGLRLSAAFDPAQLLTAIGDRLPLALAVVLIPEGGSARGKDLVDLADQIEFDISPEQVLEVVEDFFSCNPIASLLVRLKGAIGALRGKISTGLTIPSASSPAEILPGTTLSSGDVHQEQQGPT